MRFYYHFVGSGERLEDDVGIEQPDAGAARAEAVRAAREILAESLLRDLPLPDGVTIEITDGDGRLADRIPLIAAAIGDTHDGRYRRIFDAAPQASLLLSRTFVVVDANAAFLNARQTELAAIAGRSLAEVLSVDPAAPDGDGLCHLTASLHTVLRDKVAHELPRQRLDLRRRDGVREERYWRMLNVPVLDGGGEVAFILHQAEDVTGTCPAALRREVQPASAVSPPASSTS